MHISKNRCRCENLQSEALQVLSMATDWSPPLVAKTIQPSFAWCHRHGANRMDFSLYKNPLISIKVLVPNYKENLADECLLKGILSKVV